MRPVTINQHNTPAALLELERASHENDIVEIAQNFSTGNLAASQRTFLGASVQLSTPGIGNTADTNEDTLFTYPLPANALSLVGEGLSVLAVGGYAANGHNKTVRLYFGSQVYSLGTVAAGSVWLAKMTAFRPASKQQLILCEGRIDATPIAMSLKKANEDDTLPITIKVTGQSGTVAANDIQANIFSVGGAVSDVSNAFATFLSDCQKGGLYRTT